MALTMAARFVCKAGGLNHGVYLRPGMRSFSRFFRVHCEDQILKPASTSLFDTAHTTKELDQMIQKIGVSSSELESAGLGIGYSPVSIIENVIEFIHQGFGLPWWVSIIAFTAAMKLGLLPLSVQQMRAMIKMNNCRPKMMQYVNSASKFRKEGNEHAAALESQRAQQVLRDNGCSPLTSMFYGLAPLPFFISSFLAVRNISSSHLSSLAHGGDFWFPNLCAPDPLYILPVVGTIGILLNFEAAQWMSPGQSKTFRYILYGVSICTLPLTSSFSSGVVLYFAVLNFMNLLQNLFWMIPYARKYFDLPDPIPLPLSLALPSEGFLSSFKSTYRARVLMYEKEVEEKKRLGKMVQSGPIKIVSKGSEDKLRQTN